MKITFIGLGNMASAMLNGILTNRIIPQENIIGTDISPLIRNNAKNNYGINIADDNQTACIGADIIILAIKPQVSESVLAEIKESISAQTIVLSIMAGKTIAWLSDKLTKTVKIIRAMPNTPALVGEAISGVCRNSLVNDEEMENCLNLLASFGKAEEIPETLIDAVIGVSGSAPAYVFIFIEALADAAVAAGMPRAQAYRFAAQNVYGSAKLVLETGKHPGELKDMVCSPGGTTIEAVKILEERGFRSAVIGAAEAAIAKSKKL